MAKKIENVPNASVLITSMRSIGYDFESAVADIIDNSITAKAKNILISFANAHVGEPSLYIIDDGVGMSKNELIEAMRFGSIKSGKRTDDDLGRFGLGLKTASISQCKKMTVISKNDLETNGFSWDLDELADKSTWEMIELSFEEIVTKLPKEVNLNKMKSFTVVYWENFDTLDKDTILNQINRYDVFIRKIDATEKHLSLIFHRFIDEGLNIYINNRLIESLDPFLSKHPKTVTRAEQIINTKTSDNIDEKVGVKVFILPYFTEITEKKDIDKIGGKDRFTDQGFYIYRNKRLMIHGTWFKLKPKSELSGNARIMIDIPSTLDDLWSIDVKKQSAVIPKALLEQLRKEVENAVESAKRQQNYRGSIQTKDGSPWRKRVNIRDNSVSYEINRDSRIIKKLLDELNDKEKTDIEKIFTIIETSLPYNDIHNAVAEKRGINILDDEHQNLVLEMAYNQFIDYRNTVKLSEEEIIREICALEPFLSAKIESKLREKINERK